MKIRRFLCSVFFLLCTGVHATEFNAYSLVGFGGAKSDEIVLKNGLVESDICWMEKFSAQIGAGGRISCNPFVFELGVVADVPLRTVWMVDSDYESLALSEMSSHSGCVDGGFGAVFKAGYVFSVGKVRLTPSVGIEYSCKKFSARDGVKRYSDAQDSVRLTGNVVSYERRMLLPSANMDFSYVFGDEWKIVCSVGFCPYLFGNCRDGHFLRLKEFSDEFRGGYSVTCDFGFEYKRVSFRLTYRHLETGSNARSFKKNIGPEVSAREELEATPLFRSDAFGIYCVYSVL